MRIAQPTPGPTTRESNVQPYSPHQLPTDPDDTRVRHTTPLRTALPNAQQREALAPVCDEAGRAAVATLG
eukprot:1411728-Rhodomonas_salina.2